MPTTSVPKSERRQQRNSLEVRIPINDRIFTITENLLEFSIEHESTAIPFCKITFVAVDDELAALIDKGLIIELWHGSGFGMIGKTLEGTYRIDRLQEKLSEDGRIEISISARHVTSALFDSSYKRAVSTKLGSLISEICVSKDIGVSIELGNAELLIDAFIDCDAAYAALRILGANFDFLLMTTADGKLRAISREFFIRELHQKPPVVINQSDVISSVITKGLGREAR